MRSKISLLVLFALISIFTAHASFPVREMAIDRSSPTYVNDDLSKLINGNLETLKKMTPKQFEKMTGKKLTFKETVKLKAAQKMMKKEGGDLSKGLYILLAIFGLSFIAMGILDDWSGNDWWLNLLLSIICWLPGFIHAMIKMKDYYGDK